MVIVYETEKYTLEAEKKKVREVCYICKTTTVCQQTLLRPKSVYQDKWYTKDSLKQHLEDETKRIFNNPNSKDPIADCVGFDPEKVGKFEKFVFPVIKQIWPNLVAADLLDPNYYYLCGDICIQMFAIAKML